jgi:hypothetical protein
MDAQKGTAGKPAPMEDNGAGLLVGMDLETGSHARPTMTAIKTNLAE